MYEVSFTKNGLAYRYNVTRFQRAKEIAKKMNGTVRKKRVDVWIADPKTQEMFRVCNQLGVAEALDWCSVMLNDGRVGCLIIPSSKNMPRRFQVDQAG